MPLQLQALNQSAFLFLNSFADNMLIRNIAIVFSDAPIFFLPIFLVSWWLFYTRKNNIHKKESLLYIFYSTIVAVIFNMIIQAIIFVERPETFLWAKTHFALSHIPDASFPSDHATVWWAFLVGLYLFWFRKIAFYFMPFFLLMALSRVVAGVHWPLDMVGWIIVGTFAALSIFYFRKSKILLGLNSLVLQYMSRIKL